jgi:hypothetical protein
MSNVVVFPEFGTFCMETLALIGEFDVSIESDEDALIVPDIGAFVVTISAFSEPTD